MFIRIINTVHPFSFADNTLVNDIPSYIEINNYIRDYRLHFLFFSSVFYVELYYLYNVIIYGNMLEG